MDGIIVKEVESKREIRDFMNITRKIYKDCPFYVPDLEFDIRNILKRKDCHSHFSSIKPFVAYKNGIVAGRIVGIINHRANSKWNTRNVRFGMMEFIDDFRVSEALLNKVAKWGIEKGMNRIQGPMGMTDFDKEGMLIEDFDQTGSIISSYNLPYYPLHLEKIGFKKEVDWIQVKIDIPEKLPERYIRVAETSMEMFGLKIKKLTKADITERNYGTKIFTLLNTAYSPLFGFTEFSEAQIDGYVKHYLPLIDLSLVPVIENEAGEVIGIAVTMASLSQAMIKADGKLFPFGWFHILKSLKWKREDKVELLLIAVHPDYQGMGVNSLFFYDLINVYKKMNFKYAETGPQLEYNVKELSQWKSLNPQFTKRRRCYTKQLLN